jgi:hypothetical protein
VALGMVASTGCVDRVIHDLDEVAEGGGGQLDTDTDTDGLGETHQVTTGGVDPDVECTIPQDCGPEQTCYEGVCVGTGSVRVSLSWNEVTDLDLHVRVPNGEWISYEVPLTSYGQLDVDDCVSAMCVNQDGTHVENVFLDATAPRGLYGVKIINFDGRRAADYGIEVAGDVSASFVGSLPATSYYEGPVHEFTW